MTTINPDRFPSKPCERCGTVFTKAKRDSAAIWAKRKFCSRKCINAGRVKKPILDRLLDGVEVISESGCWVWMGSLDNMGYGVISTKHRQPPKRTHRLAYEHFVGAIPDDTCVVHKCGVSMCCNPNHLQEKLYYRAPIMKISKALRSLTQRYAVIEGKRVEMTV